MARFWWPVFMRIIPLPALPVASFGAIVLAFEKPCYGCGVNVTWGSMTTDDLILSMHKVISFANLSALSTELSVSWIFQTPKGVICFMSFFQKAGRLLNLPGLDKLRRWHSFFLSKKLIFVHVFRLDNMIWDILFISMAHGGSNIKKFILFLIHAWCPR